MANEACFHSEYRQKSWSKKQGVCGVEEFQSSYIRQYKNCLYVYYNEHIIKFRFSPKGNSGELPELVFERDIYCEDENFITGNRYFCVNKNGIWKLKNQGNILGLFSEQGELLYKIEFTGEELAYIYDDSVYTVQTSSAGQKELFAYIYRYSMKTGEKSRVWSLEDDKRYLSWSNEAYRTKFKGDKDVYKEVRLLSFVADAEKALVRYDVTIGNESYDASGLCISEFGVDSQISPSVLMADFSIGTDIFFSCNKDKKIISVNMESSEIYFCESDNEKEIITMTMEEYAHESGVYKNIKKLADRVFGERGYYDGNCLSYFESISYFYTVDSLGNRCEWPYTDDTEMLEDWMMISYDYPPVSGDDIYEVLYPKTLCACPTESDCLVIRKSMLDECLRRAAEMPASVEEAQEPQTRQPEEAAEGTSIFCMHCGQKLPGYAKFCFKCGQKVVYIE